MWCAVLILRYHQTDKASVRLALQLDEWQNAWDGERLTDNFVWAVVKGKCEEEIDCFTLSAPACGS